MSNGGVAGLVTIEDLLEAIVGNIEDEHDEEAADETPIAEPEGTCCCRAASMCAGCASSSRAKREDEPCVEAPDEDCPGGSACD